MTPGELNYVVTKTLDAYISLYGADSYATLNEAIGVLECAKAELYRRVVAVLEDRKLHENGEVYSDKVLAAAGGEYR